jgi:DNA-binding CsgD family transcriptional regulator
MESSTQGHANFDGTTTDAARYTLGDAEPLAHGADLSAASLLAVIDELDVGLLLCRADASLIHANTAGMRELKLGEALCLDSAQRITTVVVERRSSLLIAFDAAASGRRQLVDLSHSGARMMVAVQPLGDGSAPAAAVLLVLGRRQAATDLMLEMLCQRHAVTLAEKRVLGGLLRGLSTKLLAQHLGVRDTTIRSQVAALRAKLGVRRVDDALLMAAVLPPTASALRC